MLVTLGTNSALSAGGSTTLPYACRSVQKIFIKIDDSTGSTAWDHFVTIQLGSRTICNGVEGFGLFGMGNLVGGYNDYTGSIAYCVDLGSHQLLDNENLYVTVRAGAQALDAVDISALVDTPSAGEFPVRYTTYSDNVFTAENVLCAVNYAAATDPVDEDNANVEIRDNVTSSSPNLISASNWYLSSIVNNGATYAQRFGLLKRSEIPLTTTFNYPSSATSNRILVASQMGTSQRAVRQARNAQSIAQSQVGK